MTLRRSLFTARSRSIDRNCVFVDGVEKGIDGLFYGGDNGASFPTGPQRTGRKGLKRANGQPNAPETWKPGKVWPNTREAIAFSRVRRPAPTAPHRAVSLASAARRAERQR